MFWVLISTKGHKELEGVERVGEQQSVKGAGQGEHSKSVMSKTKEMYSDVEEMSLEEGCKKGHVPNEQVD